MQYDKHGKYTASFHRHAVNQCAQADRCMSQAIMTQQARGCTLLQQYILSIHKLSQEP